MKNTGENRYIIRSSVSMSRRNVPPVLESTPISQCCGSGMFIPDPGSECFPSRIPNPNFIFHPGSESNNSSFLTQKIRFQALGNMIRGCSSRIQGSKRHRIRIRNNAISNFSNGIAEKAPGSFPQNIFMRLIVFCVHCQCCGFEYGIQCFLFDTWIRDPRWKKARS
jgi:hypothetical protein